jgi:hypothetical protein
MVDNRAEQDLPLPTRVALLEARVRLIVLVLKGAIALIVSTMVAYIASRW